MNNKLWQSAIDLNTLNSLSAGRVQIGFIKYIIGSNSNLDPFLRSTQPDWTLFLESEGQSDLFEPKKKEKKKL